MSERPTRWRGWLDFDNPDNDGDPSVRIADQGLAGEVACTIVVEIVKELEQSTTPAPDDATEGEGG